MITNLAFLSIAKMVSWDQKVVDRARLAEGFEDGCACCVVYPHVNTRTPDPDTIEVGCAM